MGLEDYYLGDAAFADFVGALKEHVGKAFRAWQGHEALCEVCGGDDDVALAIFHFAAEGSLDWMDIRVPVLSGTTPRKCLETAAGRARLKEALLRCP